MQITQADVNNVVRPILQVIILLLFGGWTLAGILGTYWYLRAPTDAERNEWRGGLFALVSALVIWLLVWYWNLPTGTQ